MNTNGINVLSLFDGMSCGQIALERAGIKVNNYYAAEIDKHAIAVTMSNYPNTIQLGDVTKVKAADLPKIDLVIGGSPCQGFSFAGKQLNFEDPRSKLFFEFVRLVEECDPEYFMLENVKMKKEYADVITDYLLVNPVEINSALVSAQNRKRIYWSNIPGLEQPEDKGILLKDILEYFPEGAALRDKSKCVRVDGAGSPPGSRQEWDTAYTVGAMRGRYIVDGVRQDGKTNCLTTVGKDNLVLKKLGNVNPSGKGMNGEVLDINSPKSSTLTTNKGEGSKIGCIQVNPSSESQGAQPYQQNRGYSPEGKNAALLVSLGGRYKIGVLNDKEVLYRTLTPIECERLQTVPDNYTAAVSNTQRYKMLGNGWTVDVIAHIFKNMEF